MKKIKILALFLALITAGVLFWYLSLPDDKPVEPPKANVVVAKSDIPENTVITDEMVELSSVPVDLILAQTFGGVSDVVGMTARSAIVRGEQIVAARLVEIGSADSGSLAYRVTPGMRAITIGVNDTTGIKSMVHPGDHVDIIAQYQVDEFVMNVDGELETKTVPEAKLLLQMKLVLAVDQVMQQSGSPAYTTLTLEVTPEEAVRLSLSENSGLVRAILRSPLDEETVGGDSISILELTGSDLLPE
jgi:pilus assembly protein CpaB